jgi:hypothetical protein
MPAKRELTMRQLRQMLRLHHDGLGARTRTPQLWQPPKYDSFAVSRRPRETNLRGVWKAI